MTLDEIKKRIDEIKEIAGDGEVAHKLEDELYLDFIRYVAGGNGEDLEEKATFVSSTQGIEFFRWCE